MKRKFSEENVQQKRQKTYDPIVTKRKSDVLDSSYAHAKRRRQNQTELDDLRRRNFELEQMVSALVNKVSTLEYMLSVFQRNETVGNNRLIPAF